ncbi:MAG TPA: imidazole glycerol phosphate synthase subunit HisH [Chthoniobacterales bacterium]|jgi:glutamine amidotransferase|nr:imidazole glycerol phosphate synthase subunit HisH [Chthoniobacterales bacterium]
MRKKPRLGLIDYGSGNLRSVTKALESVWSEIQRISTGPIPQDLDALVLPGVGSFGDSVNQLHRRQLFDPIRSWLEAGKPFLGICLGYQLLFEHSEESPDIRGLGVLGGEVRRFTGPQIKVPQIGWNTVHWSAQTLQQFPELPADPFVYFVHSYYPVPVDSKVVAGTTDYGGRFASAIARDGLLATQFHPEKSQTAGLKILQTFVSSLA